MSKVKLADVVERSSGGGTPARDIASFWSGPIPWATVKDFKDGVRHLLGVQESITKLGLNSSSANLIPAGTPIICMRMAVGRIATATMPVAINQDLRALFVGAAFDPDFVVWSLEGIRNQIENDAIGSTVKGITIDRLLSFEILDAALPEQSKIAEVLSTVDRAIVQTDALIAKQKRIKTGLMQDLLTRGIDEHGKLRSEATHAFKDSPLGRIPVDWEVCPLERAVRPDSPITYGVVQPGKEDDYGVLFVRGGDIYQGEIDVSKLRTISKAVSVPYRRTLLKGGELLMSLVGYPGEVAVVPESLAGANIARQVALIRLSDHFAPSFVMCYLLSPDGKRQVLGASLGSAQQVVNLKDLRMVAVPMPGVEEQALIAQRFAGVFLQQIEAMRSLKKLLSLKTALMQDLLTGKVRVTPLLQQAEEAASA